ncbi:tetratricopeptide repeat protein [Myxococcus sp. K15C18031901]|uniref:tetratricopeptide repeat protein n=1 Tax=Myxococcus dinghuensis TaxID=2906761 RepID=UPI0020A8225F|nr:tetratricopeptide repeat protein [Myxococcus dinghuensis]MCP3104591.1 tetratricopeptide repeat protein [Myxococcus dinghuensis]
MRTFRRGLTALALVAGLSGCSHTTSTAAAPHVLESAAEKARSGSDEARTLALAGFHAYLMAGDATQAQQRFDAAVAKDAGEPYGLMGQHLLARRAGRTEVALTAALELVRRAPTHPLAVIAARHVLESAGTAPPLDDAILQATEAGLGAGATGETAYLLRGARLAVALARGDALARDVALRELGGVSDVSLVGPLSAFHVLSWDEALPAVKNGSLAGPFTGAFGTVPVRTLRAPDGRLDLAGEPGEGDLYLMAFDVEVAETGAYVARTVSATSHQVVMDGAPLLERAAWGRATSTVAARAVKLTAGKHRVLVRQLKGATSGVLSFTLLRADGKPSAVRFTPATGAAPATWGTTPLATAEATDVYPTARSLKAALAGEAGELLSTVLAARDGLARDPDGARELMAGVEATTPALLSLRAELAAADRTVPSKVARGRATRDLEAVLTKDPGNVAALLQRADLFMDDGQPASALETLKTAGEVSPKAGPPLYLLRARAALALDVDSLAEESLTQALQLQPRLCEALGLQYNLARRRDAVERADALVESQRDCPGFQVRLAEHARTRGDLETAAKQYTDLLTKDPSSVSAGVSLASIYIGQRKHDEAMAVLRGLEATWPRSTELLKRMADVREYAGAPAEALTLREKALALEGDDLTLRRAVERAKTGKELLQEHAIDGREALREYEAEPVTGGSAVFVLDAAAVRVYPDGSVVNRIHTIQKALEQSGVQEIAEVNVPRGAQVLALRTLKADGRVLEPENIEGKDTVSLPGVQVGDSVEVEYLLAESPRGPAQPGFTASAFYFRIANQPNAWTTYTVVAPKGTGMKVDAHGMKAPAPTVVGDEEVFHYEAHRVPPFIPEPDAPPSGNEYLPFVMVGAGATGNESLVRVYGDAFQDRWMRTAEVEDFARKAAEGKKGLEAVKAVHAAVMARFTGRDNGLGQSAASTVAQDRGSRLSVLKAGLESLGIRTRVAAVRTFNVDPSDYLFPYDSLLPYAALRVELPGAEPIWVDTSVRYGPFGELPEYAMGERDAYLLPEPGRAPEKVKTPALKEAAGKKVKLMLALDADGKLSGKGEETYSGFEAAQLAEAFNQLSAESRNQALQGAVARYFGGASLSSVTLDRADAVGAPFVLRYEFTVPRFGRMEGDQRMALGPLTFPAQLGRRYVQLSSRRTPLYIDNTEASGTEVTLALPSGWKLPDPQPALDVRTPFGRFSRTEKVEGSTLTVTESLRVLRDRVPPNKYEQFSGFTGDVDLIQTREMFLVKQ